MQIKMISPKTHILHFTSMRYESLYKQHIIYSTASSQKTETKDIKYG